LDTYLFVDLRGDTDDGVTMTDLSRCKAARSAINAAGSNRPLRSGRATPYRPVHVVREQIKARVDSGQNIAATRFRNLPSAIITLLCAAALVALAVAITMLPFVLL
jgi:hypothetical protein